MSWNTSIALSYVVFVQIFSAIPFLYELRELLDWSCTATCLTLFDWLKLEDINTSLFFVTCNRRSRRRHRLGERQPRWLKFFQVQPAHSRWICGLI